MPTRLSRSPARSMCSGSASWRRSPRSSPRTAAAAATRIRPRAHTRRSCAPAVGGRLPPGRGAGRRANALRTAPRTGGDGDWRDPPQARRAVHARGARGSVRPVGALVGRCDRRVGRKAGLGALRDHGGRRCVPSVRARSPGLQTMSVPPREYVRRYRPRRRRRTLLRLALALVVVAAVFALGIALGQALHDNPKPGPDVTRVRTLTPKPLAPARETVTVTVAKSTSAARP